MSAPDADRDTPAAAAATAAENKSSAAAAAAPRSATGEADPDADSPGPAARRPSPSSLDPLFVYGVKPEVRGGLSFAGDSNASLIYPAGCGIAVFDTRVSRRQEGGLQWYNDLASGGGRVEVSST